MSHSTLVWLRLFIIVWSLMFTALGLYQVSSLSQSCTVYAACIVINAVCFGVMLGRGAPTR